eukprot:jgi/Galph1/4856/GphlegSOOS_G3567.1
MWLDIQQFVAGEICTTTIVTELSEENSSLFIKDILLFGHRNNVEVDFEMVRSKEIDESKDQRQKNYTYAITFSKMNKIPVGFFAQVTGLLATYEVNLDFAERLSEPTDSLACYELIARLDTEKMASLLQEQQGTAISAEEVLTHIRQQILALGKKYSVDTAFQRSDLLHRTKRLVVFDLSWTLISNDALNIVIEAASELEESTSNDSLLSQLASLQRQHEEGNLIGDAYFLERVGLLKDFPMNVLIEKISKKLSFTEGATFLCRALSKLGYKTAIISSGPHFVVEQVKKSLGMDFGYGNILETDSEGRFTGQVVLPIINASRKADLLQMLTMQERIGLDQVIAVGDGPVSLEMLYQAGMAISVDQPEATNLEVGAHICGKSLMSVLYLLGIRGRDAFAMIQEPL